MMRKGMRRSLGVVVGFLAFVGIAASATHYLYEPYNPGFLRFPTIVALHVVLGGVYLVLAPLQFVRRIRTRHLGYHRWAGRLLVAIGLVVGATALFMGMVIPFSGWVERGYIGLFGGLFVVTVIKGYVHVRAGRVTLHREWTIRAFAVGLAVATQRLIFIPAILVVSAPTQGQLKTLSAAAFLAAFVVHASVAETWIRLTRKRGVPRLGAVPKANLNYPRAREARMEKWNQGAILGVWLIVNPIVFPDPKSDRAWATRAMLGEEMWIAERPLDRAMALNVGATAFGFGGVRGAYKRRLLPPAVCTVGQVALLLAYWREMVAYYERHRTKPPTTAQDVRLWPPE